MFICIILAVCTAAADQFFKYLVVSDMFLGQSIPIVPGIFHLTYIQNPGAAFGILANQRWLFVAIAVALIAAAVYFAPQIKRLSFSMRTAIALLVGGAAGNLIDRISIGRVIDYMDFRVWPIFNFADIAIVLGCLFIIGSLLFSNQESKA